MHSIIEQLKKHEGFKSKPYKDTEGFLTIGYGWNLDVNGLPEDICETLLRRKTEEIYKILNKYDVFKKLDNVRKKVLLDMAYNLGINSLFKFEKMFNALEEDDYEKAAEEMRDSKWAKQVKTRADRLIKMMKTGEDYG